MTSGSTVSLHTRNRHTSISNLAVVQCSKIFLVLAVPVLHAEFLFLLWHYVRGADAISADSRRHFHVRLCVLGTFCRLPDHAPGESPAIWALNSGYMLSASVVPLPKCCLRSLSHAFA